MWRAPVHCFCLALRFGRRPSTRPTPPRCNSRRARPLTSTQNAPRSLLASLDSLVPPPPLCFNTYLDVPGFVVLLLRLFFPSCVCVCAFAGSFGRWPAAARDFLPLVPRRPRARRALAWPGRVGARLPLSRRRRSFERAIGCLPRRQTRAAHFVRGETRAARLAPITARLTIRSLAGVLTRPELCTFS